MGWVSEGGNQCKKDVTQRLEGKNRLKMLCSWLEEKIDE